MKNRLDFCVVGPQRTSTTWIYEVLLNSGQVHLPVKVKETFFFDQKFDKGLSYYFGLFDDMTDDRLIGEVAPTYFHQQSCIERIYNHAPTCKILIIYRNPVDKAISLYKHHLRKGRVGKSMEKAVAKYPEILDSGRYHDQVLHWRQKFGEDQVKVISYKLLKEDSQSYMNEITEFLGLQRILIGSQFSGKINEASMPKYPFLARIFSFGAALLRRFDLHRIANLGKSIGLAKVYSGGSGVNNRMEKEREWLAQQFTDKDFMNG